MKQLVTIGIFFIFLGFLFAVLGSLFQESGKETGKTKTAGGFGGTKIAFGGFIGPIPFGWANDRRLLYPLMGFLTVMALVWIVWQMMQR